MPGRPTVPQPEPVPECESAPDATSRVLSGILERETGFEPAILTLGSRAGVAVLVRKSFESAGALAYRL